MPGVPGRPQGAHVRPRPAPQCQQAQAPSAVRDPAGVRPPWRAHEARAVQQVRGQGQGDRALEEGARWRARGRGPVPALVVRARRAASTGEASVCVLFVACPLSPLLCCVLLLTVLAGGVGAACRAGGGRRGRRHLGDCKRVGRVRLVVGPQLGLRLRDRIIPFPFPPLPLLSLCLLWRRRRRRRRHRHGQQRRAVVGGLSCSTAAVVAECEFAVGVHHVWRAKGGGAMHVSCCRSGDCGGQVVVGGQTGGRGERRGRLVTGEVAVSLCAPPPLPPPHPLVLLLTVCYLGVGARAGRARRGRLRAGRAAQDSVAREAAL
jgi:hypothetical protein